MSLLKELNIYYKNKFMEIIIYGIFDPNEPETIRYIGKTKKSIKERLYKHIYLSKKGVKRPLNLWIKKLLDSGIIPEIKEIEKTNIDEWDGKEIYWISYYRNNGDLLNLSDGGGSNLNYSPSDETRKKISEANKGKIGYWKGKKMSEEHKQKISEGGLGKKRSDTTKQKISESLNGRKLTDNHKLNLSKSHKGQISKNKKPVIKLCLETGKELEVYESLEIAMIKNNIKSKGNLVSVCQNKRKKCGGFSWKYVN